MTVYSAIQMIESGTTGIMYNHSQTPVARLEKDVDDVLRGFADTGMRAAFSVLYRDQNRVVYTDDDQFLAGLPTDLAAGIRKYLAATDLPRADYFRLFEQTYEKHGTDPDDRITVLLSPANAQWASDEFLQTTKEYATKYQTGIHMHLVETFYQKEYGIRAWSKTPAAHLQELGFLGPELSCAHGIWLTENDIDLLAGNGTTVCHNPSSNLRLKNGVAPVNAMLAGGMNVSLGTDSCAINDDDDMIQEMRLAAKLHREPSIAAPAINSHQVLKMATINAAKPTFFHQSIGALEKGKRADIVLMDLSAIEEPYLDSRIDIVDALLYRGKARQVDTVLIDGEVVLRDGRFTKLDKQAVMQEFKEQFARPVEDSTLQGRKLLRELMPYVERFYQEWSPGDGPPHYMYNSRR
jgi:cytosine/adenosine deaminase-related metal-dependent hydrolase